MKVVLNRKGPGCVLCFVLMMFRLSGFLAVLGLASCSSSRMIGREQELPVGNHVVRTVMGSDFLVPKGASLVVDYSSGSRFFVEEGGVLAGFKKGAELTTIYAETGAVIPNARIQEGVTVRTVADAGKSYRTRHQELLPVGMQMGNVRGGGVVPVVGVGGFWGGWGPGWGWGRGWGSVRGGGRSISVRPSSYRRSN